MLGFQGIAYLAYLAEADDSRVEPANDLLRRALPGCVMVFPIFSGVPRPLPVHVGEGNVGPVLCSSGLPVCSRGHISNALPRWASRHARGAECGVTPA